MAGRRTCTAGPECSEAERSQTLPHRHTGPTQHWLNSDNHGIVAVPRADHCRLCSYAACARYNALYNAQTGWPADPWLASEKGQPEYCYHGSSSNRQVLSSPQNPLTAKTQAPQRLLGSQRLSYTNTGCDSIPCPVLKPEASTLNPKADRCLAD